MRIQKLISTAFLLLFIQAANAQSDSLLNMISDSQAVHKKTMYVTGTFKAIHFVNMQTIEQPAQGSMNFIIQHRFGQLNSGAYNFFGLDNATLRLGLDYGITNRLAVGVGRSSYLKTFDGYLKYKLLRQTDGSEQMPLSVSVLGTISNYTQQIVAEPYLDADYRTAYTGQLLLARKFCRTFSMEITPTYLRYNLVPTINDKNNIFVIGSGARMKITNRTALNVEYNYLLPNQVVSYIVHNSFSIGYDIETGGHVFQLVITNSQSMTESQYLAQTPGRWDNGDLYFGFNISRNFNITKKAKGTWN
jgi:uncharacterized beta barrel domain-containing protein DUF5777